MQSLAIAGDHIIQNVTVAQMQMLPKPSLPRTSSLFPEREM